MATEEAKITFRPNGKVEVEAQGFTGDECTKALDFLDQMGQLEEREMKQEVFEAESDVVWQKY